jgi:hypothetical protein
MGVSEPIKRDNTAKIVNRMACKMDKHINPITHIGISFTKDKDD